MPNEVNYKAKYMELRSKFMSSVDAAWRDGFEHGSQSAQQQQAQQQQQMDHEQTMASLAPQQPGQPGQGAPGQDMPGADGKAPDSANPQGSELDQHIAKLEGMLGQPEVDAGQLKKAVDELKFAVEMKKSSEAIPAISRALHKPSYNIGRIASHNMNDSAKKAVAMQHKIVNDVMKGFAEEEARAKKDIRNILSVEGLTKGE